MAHSSRTWRGARTPSSLKRVRSNARKHDINQARSSATKTLVRKAVAIATSADTDGASTAVIEAVSALDKAARNGTIHPNAAARRKSRLMTKVNAAHLLDTAETSAPTTAKKRTTASKTAQRKKVAAAKASKAAAGKAADRPRTAAGKAKVAVTRASRESAAARRRAQETTEDEG